MYCRPRQVSRIVFLEPQSKTIPNTYLILVVGLEAPPALKSRHGAHARVPHGLDLEAVPGGGGWLWRQLLAARSRLTGAVDPSAQKKVLRAERPRLPMTFGAVPMPDDSVWFASSCRAVAPRTQPGCRLATTSTEYASVQRRQHSDRAVWWMQLIWRQPSAYRQRGSASTAAGRLLRGCRQHV